MNTSETETAEPSYFEPEIITTRQFDGRGNIIVTQSFCGDGYPDDAVLSSNQLIAYKYNLFVQRGINPMIAMAYIERRVHHNLTFSFMDCWLDGESPIEIGHLSSAPIDRLLRACPESDGQNDCYEVQAGISLDILYWERRRNLQNIQDMRLVDKFGPFLNELHASGWLRGPYSEIVKMPFQGFSNIETPGKSTFEGFKDEAPDVSAIIRGGGNAPKDGSRVPVAMAGLAVAVASIALLVVLVMAARTRRNQREARELKELERKRDSSFETYPHAGSVPDFDDEEYPRTPRRDQKEIRSYRHQERRSMGEGRYQAGDTVEL